MSFDRRNSLFGNGYEARRYYQRSVCTPIEEELKKELKRERDLFETERVFLEVLKQKGYRFKLFEKGVATANNRAAWCWTNIGG